MGMLSISKAADVFAVFFSLNSRENYFSEKEERK
jgi:hypothetical protein